MFLKQMVISNGSGAVIRDIKFKSGLNLIIDNTPTSETKQTGNDVGKTTVLKLIDFCLGAKPNIIYTDTENTKNVYQLVKDFLEDNNVRVTLILKENLEDENSREVVIERNFLSRNNAVRRINGKDMRDSEFENELCKAIFQVDNIIKPSFRQIISHNIRYKDDSINNTLKTLSKFAKDVEYETLYLFLLGCNFDAGEKKQELISKLRQETSFRERIEGQQTKASYKVALEIIDNEIKTLDLKKHSFNINENFTHELNRLNDVKRKINKCSSNISKLKIRKDLIEQSKTDLSNSVSKIDMQQLKDLYYQAKMNVEGIQKTFEELVVYHNKMLVEKSKFIGMELPHILESIEKQEYELAELLREEKELTERVSKCDSFDELEVIVNKLNEKHRLKGEYEGIISQMNESDDKISEITKQLDDFENLIFSEEFGEKLKKQLKKFNEYFSSISSEIYNETYVLKYDVTRNKNDQPLYKFSSFNANISSGKKQGEILCFDLAYILFADSEGIPCLHFLLNDKKELMHDNQLIKVSDFVKSNNAQLVVSILKDKLPTSVVDKSHIAIELSQEEKLFKIE
ncbi:MAG: DUF2326 domain-containing protein [Clostridia bacterium]|nr:DUF2326 domain-containing protein [Clostridia bacterium]